jgi:hypothetical protein
MCILDNIAAGDPIPPELDDLLLCAFNASSGADQEVCDGCYPTSLDCGNATVNYDVCVQCSAANCCDERAKCLGESSSGGCGPRLSCRDMGMPPADCPTTDSELWQEFVACTNGANDAGTTCMRPPPPGGNTAMLCYPVNTSPD